MNLVTVVEKDGHGDVAAYDIYSRLLKDRIIFLSEDITESVSAAIVAQMLFLSKTNKKQIDFYIMTDGGSVESGLAIYDTMQYIRNDVATYCIGGASSMGAILLAAGSKGKRFALPRARIMIHQPWGGSEGAASDIAIQAKEMENTKKILCKILSFHTGREEKKVMKDCDRDFYMSAGEALKYGLIDRILEREEQ